MASSSVISSDTMSAPSSSSLASAGLLAYSNMPEGPNSSPRWTAHSTLPSSAMDSASYNPPHFESPLTSSPHSRTTGLPTVSSPLKSSSLLPNVEISSPTHITIHSNSCQNAGSVLNQSVTSSSVSRSNAQSSTEPLVPQHNSSHHGLNNSSTRPRTSNQVFSSTSDLAAHYGIPTTLPPLPSIQFRRSEPVTQPSSTAVPDFFALKDNYLSMLSQKSESTSAPSSTEMLSATVSPADLQQPVAADFNDIEGLLRSIAQGSTESDMSPFEPSDFLTSPWTPSLDTFGESPGETPLSDFLSTPLIPDNDLSMLTGPHDMPLFDDSSYLEYESSKAPSIDTSTLLTMPPTSPNLGLDPASLISPALPMENTTHFSTPHQPLVSPAPADTSSSPANPARRRTSATGTRKNITTDSLVPIDAPTQPRRYLTPSATSRKELPAVFARKRARQQMEEEDELDEPLKPNATELEQIEWKRRQNTLAARKSRKRKLLHQQELENQVSALTNEREKWRQRALTLQGILQANGIPFTEFQD